MIATNPPTSDRITIRILSTLAVMGAMSELARLYQASNGVTIEADFSPTAALLERLRAG
jgi:molybdate transport system substrate-binding protein